MCRSAPAAIENTPAEEHGFDCSRSFISLLDSFSVLDGGRRHHRQFPPMQHDILIAIIPVHRGWGKAYP